MGCFSPAAPDLLLDTFGFMQECWVDDYNIFQRISDFFLLVSVKEYWDLFSCWKYGCGTCKQYRSYFLLYNLDKRKMFLASSSGGEHIPNLIPAQTPAISTLGSCEYFPRDRPRFPQTCGSPGPRDALCDLSQYSSAPNRRHHPSSVARDRRQASDGNRSVDARR